MFKNSAAPAVAATISQRQPYLKELGPGGYRWCACGRSQNQPWCDDSHQGTPYLPIHFTIKPRATLQTVWLCGCRQSKHLPFCDGSHNKL